MLSYSREIFKNGIVPFEEYEKEMIRKFGESVKPYVFGFYHVAVAQHKQEEETKVEQQAPVEVPPPAPVQVQAVIPEMGESYDLVGVVIPDVDTRTGEPVWLVKMKQYVSRSHYEVLKKRAIDNGGYYSVFKKAFLFKQEADANNFNKIKTYGNNEQQIAERSRDSILEGRVVAANLRDEAENQSQDGENRNARSEAERLRGENSILRGIAETSERSKTEEIGVVSLSGVESIEREITETLENFSGDKEAIQEVVEQEKRDVTKNQQLTDFAEQTLAMLDYSLGLQGLYQTDKYASAWENAQDDIRDLAGRIGVDLKIDIDPSAAYSFIDDGVENSTFWGRIPLGDGLTLHLQATTHYVDDYEIDLGLPTVDPTKVYSFYVSDDSGEKKFCPHHFYSRSDGYNSFLRTVENDINAARVGMLEERNQERIREIEQDYQLPKHFANGGGNAQENLENTFIDYLNRIKTDLGITFNEKGYEPSCHIFDFENGSNEMHVRGSLPLSENEELKFFFPCIENWDGSYTLLFNTIDKNSFDTYIQYGDSPQYFNLDVANKDYQQTIADLKVWMSEHIGVGEEQQQEPVVEDQLAVQSQQNTPQASQLELNFLGEEVEKVIENNEKLSDSEDWYNDMVNQDFGIQSGKIAYTQDFENVRAEAHRFGENLIKDLGLELSDSNLLVMLSDVYEDPFMNMEYCGVSVEFVAKDPQGEKNNIFCSINLPFHSSLSGENANKIEFGRNSRNDEPYRHMAVVTADKISEEPIISSSFNIFEGYGNFVNSLKKQIEQSREIVIQKQESALAQQTETLSADEQQPAVSIVDSTPLVEHTPAEEAKQEQAEPAEIAEPVIKNTRNFVDSEKTDYASLGLRTRFEYNLEAINLMHRLNNEQVEVPTPEQMEVLKRFSGWGGLSCFFTGSNWYEQRRLNDTLTDKEMREAKLALNSSYFTPASIIDSLWEIAEKVGFKGGKILEGSAGVGKILGAMPESIKTKSDIQAVEIDETSGKILKLLYPDAKVDVQGFEKTKIENKSVDLAITNVPFVTDLRVFDPLDRDLSKKFVTIQDFCIAKNVRKLKEGGIGIFIAPSTTLDKSKELFSWLDRDGETDVIGAFRLNNKTFAGTNATSDIIVVRKRVNGQKSAQAIDVSHSAVERIVTYIKPASGRQVVDIERNLVLDYNKYFQEHPENMGGVMEFGCENGDLSYRPETSGLFSKSEISQQERLKNWIENVIPTQEFVQTVQQTSEESQTNKQEGRREGELFVDDNNKIYLVVNKEAVPLDLNPNKVAGKYDKTEVIKDYIALKKALQDCLNYQTSRSDDFGLSIVLGSLNQAYDDFVGKYGQLNKNIRISFLKNDVDWASTAAIENYIQRETAEGKKYFETHKTDVFKKRVVNSAEFNIPTNIKDAVVVSMRKFGTVNEDIISQWLNTPKDRLRKDILDSGLCFVNPLNEKLEVRYIYLSGNVREKMILAQELNVDGKYDKNIKELENVLPLRIPSHLIHFSLGTTWVPTSLYNDYLKEKLDVDGELVHLNGVWSYNNLYNTKNHKDREGGVWSEKFYKQTYGHDILLAAFNNKEIEVKQHHSSVDLDGKKNTTVEVDTEAMAQIAVKIQDFKDDFEDWATEKIKNNEKLRQDIEEIYNTEFNSIAPLQVDEVFMPEGNFEGVNPNVNLYLHQKKAAIKCCTQPQMLAHEVGSGKTWTLVSSAMEMKRMGMAKKPMIVVQNATLEQFVKSAKELYPSAKILTITDKDNTPEGRGLFYSRIKYNDWDMVIIPQTVLDKIPDSIERQVAFIEERIEEKIAAIAAAMMLNTDKKNIGDLEKEVERLINKANDLKYIAIIKANEEVKALEQMRRSVDGKVENFDQLGVDALLVDEAHNYKRLGFETSISRVKGIDTASSHRSVSLYLKTRSIYEKMGWKNVVFATGTPISNTAAELWTFMRYLAPPEFMRANHIRFFDDFVHNFGKINQVTEFTTSGKYKAVSRFSSYVNLPELARVWGSCADTVLTKDVDYINEQIPKTEKGYVNERGIWVNQAEDVFLEQSDSLVAIMKSIKRELEEWEAMEPEEKWKKKYVPVVMYGLAKRAAIDTRLVSPDAPDEPMSKTNQAVKTTLEALEKTKDYNGTVAIFCDNYTRKERVGGSDKRVVVFNLYDDIKRKLIAQGIPENQIAVMRSGMSDTKKEQIFAKVNSGEIRVVLGSTSLLGTGVNIQERLHTLIHMDAPDRPMDYIQRTGRILRQGNLHQEWDKPVQVLRFGVKDSLDITAYQRLQTKSQFINSAMDNQELLKNNKANRLLEAEEIGLFDNPVAVLSGSQFALMKLTAEREYRKYSNHKKNYETNQIWLNTHIPKYKETLAGYQTFFERNTKSAALVAEKFPTGKPTTITINGIPCKSQEEVEAAITAVNKIVNEKMADFRKSYRDDTVEIPIPVEIDGVAFNAKVNLIKGAENSNSYNELKLVIHRNVSYSCEELGISETASGAYFKNMLEDLTNNVVSGKTFTELASETEHKIKVLSAEIEQMEASFGVPFEEEDKLREAEIKVKEFTEQMEEELREIDAKYSNRDESGISIDIDAMIDDAFDDEDEREDEERKNEEKQIDDLEYGDVLTEEEKLAAESIVYALRGARIPVEFVSESEALQNEDFQYSIAQKEIASQKETGKPNEIVERPDGTKISKSALEAEQNGVFAKTRFLEVYKMTPQEFNCLKDLGIVRTEETYRSGTSNRQIAYYTWIDNTFHNTKGTVNYTVHPNGVVDDGSVITGATSLYGTFQNLNASTKQLINETYNKQGNSIEENIEIRKTIYNNFNLPQQALTNQNNELQEKVVAFDAWLQKNIESGAIVEHNRINTKPELFVITNEEMQGKYGWFQAKDIYNLPIFYTGLEFTDSKTLEEYKRLQEEINQSKKTKQKAEKPQEKKSEKIEVFEKNNVVYGWTDGKKVFLTKKGLNPETPIHEYTHLWVAAMRKRAPREWEKIKNMLRDTPIWEQVMNDDNYKNIRNDEDKVASEALARMSGKANVERMKKYVKDILVSCKDNKEVEKKRFLLYRMKAALHHYWGWIGTKLFNMKFKNLSEVTDRILYDVAARTNLYTGDNPHLVKERIKAEKAAQEAKNKENAENQENAKEATNEVAKVEKTVATPQATTPERKNQNFYTFDEFRSLISIKELAEYYGYTFDKSGGFRKPKMRHPSGDIIILSNPDDKFNQLFFTPKNDSKGMKGNLFNFVNSRIEMGIIPNPLSYPDSENKWKVVNAVLRNYLETPSEIKAQNQEFIPYAKEKIENMVTVSDFGRYCTENLDNPVFLRSRGISAKTIEDPLFKGRIFNSDNNHLFEDKIQTTQNNAPNIALPIWNSKDEMVGLELRNKNYKSFVVSSQKSIGVWHSNIPEKIEQVVMTESPLDCLAHYQLKPNPNTLYFAFGGNLCSDQLKTMREVMNANHSNFVENATLKLATDNDLAGSHYDFMIMKERVRPATFEFEQMPSENGKCKIAFNVHEDYIPKLESELNKTTTLDWKRVELTEPKDLTKSERIEIAYSPKEVLPQQELTKVLMGFLGKYEFEKAVLKDWNDDLMGLQEINKQSKQPISWEEFAENKEKFMAQMQESQQENQEVEQKETPKRGMKIH